MHPPCREDPSRSLSGCRAFQHSYTQSFGIGRILLRRSSVPHFLDRSPARQRALRVRDGVVFRTAEVPVASALRGRLGYMIIAASVA
jgi:hypothetical protein